MDGRSALSHLQSVVQSEHPGVHLLQEQYRMHPQVNAVVSAYQYEKKLLTASAVRQRNFAMPSMFASVY